MFIGSANPGTGFLLSPDGYLLTNAHVVCNSPDERVRVRFDDGTEQEAAVLITDLKHDLALLKLEAEGLPTLPLGDSDEVHVGDPVTVIGYPQRFGTPTKVITQGIVSQKDVPDGYSACGQSIRIEDLILTTAPIVPGNSGGPMLNETGEVIGVVNSASSFAGAAIPIDTVKEQLCAWEREGLIPSDVRRAVERPLVLFEEDFNAPGDWAIWPPPGAPFLLPLFPYARMGIEDGEFSLTVESENFWMVGPLLNPGLAVETLVALFRCFLGPECALRLEDVLSGRLLHGDFHLQFYARQVDGPPGGFGVDFRRQDFFSEFYRFAVDREGYYHLVKKVGEEWLDLIPWTFSPHLRQGSAWNKLEVVAVGPEIRLYANGWLLAVVSDPTLAEGYILPFVEAWEEPGVHVHFDDFRVLATDERERICG